MTSAWPRVGKVAFRRFNALYKIVWKAVYTHSSHRVMSPHSDPAVLFQVTKKKRRTADMTITKLFKTAGVIAAFTTIIVLGMMNSSRRQSP